MAVNKRALIRYKVLNNCFSRRFKKFFIEDLMEECGNALSEHFGTKTTISRKQIFNDMRFMKSEAGYAAPIESIKDGKKVYYRYSDKYFSIFNSPLTPREKEMLQNAIEIFGRVKGLQKYEWLGEMETKLTTHINEEMEEIISFEQNEDLIGLKHLNPLYNYIKNKTVLKITYKSFRMDEPIELRIHPYYLKQYNSRWFLFGLNDEYQTIQNLALDRIEALESDKKDYIKSEYDFKEYFEEIIGVTVPADAEEEKVLLRFSETRYPYVISKPLHRSQKIREDNTILLELKVNKELISKLLSYGSDLEVLEPESLKDKIKEEVEKMKEMYS